MLNAYRAIFCAWHTPDAPNLTYFCSLKIEVVKLEAEEQRVSQQAATAEAESALRKVKEEHKDTIRRLEGNHKAQVESLIAEKALVMADADGARLKRQVESQKVCWH